MTLTATKPTQPTERSELETTYNDIRQRTERLCEPLEIEDYVPQPITDVSPPKWHLAHTTWFFENFLLKGFEPDFHPYHPQYAYLFNSYYQHEGERWQKPERGQLSRPTVKEIYAYRKAVDERMQKLMDELEGEKLAQFKAITELGLNHEQQHQELLIYDIKYILANNPLFPVYNTFKSAVKPANKTLPEDYFDYIPFDEGVFEVGHQGKGFAYDNELPVQKVFLHDFELRKGLVTNEEYLGFIDAGGYSDFKYWLNDGWNWLQETGIKTPLYWHQMDSEWMEKTLNGLQPLNPKAPVTHLSFYEAEAFATWKGKRLPTEFEWEIAARMTNANPQSGNFQEDFLMHPDHPMPAYDTNNQLYQILGDVWEWTNSNYLPYHNYEPAEGALGEYNGKFMANQMVLRGGSCATPRDHIRLSYRNFFHPDKRWVFNGIRLAG